MIRYILVLLLLAGCISTPQHLNPSVYYRHDLCFEYETNNLIKKKIKNFFKRFKGGRYRRSSFVRDKVKFCGIGVLPYMDEYKIKVTGYGKLNYFALTTCHEETTSENPDDGIRKKNGQIKISYTPTIERGKACPLYISAYNRTQKHAWGIIVLEDPRYTLGATLYCNGYVQEYKGVSACHSRQQLLQKITFNEPVKLLDPVTGAAGRAKPCPSIGKSGKKEYEFLLPGRECFYGFIGMKTLKVHKLFTSGYEDVIIRE